MVEDSPKYGVFHRGRQAFIADGSGQQFFGSEHSARIVRDNALDPARHDVAVVRISAVA